MSNGKELRVDIAEKLNGTVHYRIIELLPIFNLKELLEIRKLIPTLTLKKGVCARYVDRSEIERVGSIKLKFVEEIEQKEKRKKKYVKRFQNNSKK